MGHPPLRYPNVVPHTEAERRELRICSSGIGGVGTAAVTNANAPIRCDETEVALIDEIEMSALQNIAATSATCSLMINGRTSGELGATSSADPEECKFHFPGTATATLRRTGTISLKPRGNMVVSPSSTLWVKSTSATAGAVHCHIKFRKKRLARAIADGDIKPGGGIPLIASTNSVNDGVGDGTVAATAKKIVNPSPNQGIEILGFYLTGHNFNAASDDIRLGFWDGTTGTFTANGNMIFRGYAMGVSNQFAPRVLVDDTRGCIQTAPSAAGNGIWIQASANLAGNPAPADYIVMYRYINVAEVAPSDGVIGQTPTSRRKWWCHTEAAAGASVNDFFAAPSATTAARDQMIKVHGHAYSATVSNTDNGVIGLQWGTGLDTNLSDFVTLRGDGTAATVSSSGARTGLNVMVRHLDEPGFFAFSLTGLIASRSQLAWGTFGGPSDTATRFHSIVP